MDNAEFQNRWQSVKHALETLISRCLQSEDSELRSRITSIYNERPTTGQADKGDQGKWNEVSQSLDALRFTLKELVLETQSLRGDQSLSIQGAAVRDNSACRTEGTDMQLPKVCDLNNQGKFSIITQLGGSVYLAKKRGTGDCCALKFYACSSDSERDEVKAVLQKLVSSQHPSLVPFVGWEFVDCHVVVMMKLIRGVSLDRWLEDESSRDKAAISERKKILLQLAEGVAALHAIDMAHRDVKTANVILDEAAELVTLVDFGSLTDSKREPLEGDLLEGDLLAKPVSSWMYKSPEMLLGNTSIADVKSDVWALGVIAYEMLVGCFPFLLKDSQECEGPAGGKLGSAETWSAEEKESLLRKLKEQPLPHSYAIHPGVLRVLRRATDKGARKRQKDAVDFRHDLAASLAAADMHDVSQSDDSLCALSVEEVASLFRRCNFEHAAAAVESNGVDGKTLLMLGDDDFSRAVADGGLGLSLLQAKRVRAEMKVYERY
eukprot:752207-Hanusia_phi.AAC.2